MQSNIRNLIAVFLWAFIFVECSCQINFGEEKTSSGNPFSTLISQFVSSVPSGSFGKRNPAEFPGGNNFGPENLNHGNNQNTFKPGNLNSNFGHGFQNGNNFKPGSTHNSPNGFSGGNNFGPVNSNNGNHGFPDNANRNPGFSGGNNFGPGNTESGFPGGNNFGPGNTQSGFPGGNNFGPGNTQSGFPGGNNFGPGNSNNRPLFPGGNNFGPGNFNNENSQPGFPGGNNFGPENANKNPGFQAGNNFNPNGHRSPKQEFNANNNFGQGNSKNPHSQTSIENGTFNPDDDDFEYDEDEDIVEDNSVDELTGRSPNCRAFNRQRGVCVPVFRCGRIGRILQRRGPIRAATVIQKSLCGFRGIVPNVCCPMGRSQPSKGNKQSGKLVEPSKPTTILTTTNRPRTTPRTRRPGTPARPFTTSRPHARPTTPRPPATTTIFTKPPTRPTRRHEPAVTFTPASTTRPTTRSTTIPTTQSSVPVTSGGLILVNPGDSKPRGPLSGEGLSNCGYSNASHSRIVGGRVAEKGAWPWIAALGYYEDDTDVLSFLCGGALISDRYVLTAAHCVHNRDDLASVRLGDHDLYSDTDGAQPMEIPIQQVIKHPNYNPQTFYNDIALIRLSRSVPFSHSIHTVCLPSTPSLRNERFEGLTPFVAGWGAINFNGPSSSVLREVQVPVVSEKQCQEKFQGFSGIKVDKTNLCAGFQSGGKDACQGDSGGPLMMPVPGNRYVLIGIVSFGFKCAEPGYPGVYSRVTTHLDWIDSVIS